MIDQLCAICGKQASFDVVFPANFAVSKINEGHFSARRIPDHIHYRLVKCRKCGLIFSTPILKPKQIARLYKESKFTYTKEVKDLKKTYAHYLDEALVYTNVKNSFLEIGCGNGFFLQEAIKRGFKQIYGVEPSLEATKKAPNLAIRKKIIPSIFKRTLFKNNFFDFICFFHTLDHIVTPNQFLKDCHQVLKKGGVVLCITHDSQALSARILGESSPIFDIEHTYLFDKKTLKLIFEKNDFKVITVEDVINTYSINYWIKMLPIPKIIQKLVVFSLEKSGFGKINLKLKAGNIAIIAQNKD